MMTNKAERGKQMEDIGLKRFGSSVAQATGRQRKRNGGFLRVFFFLATLVSQPIMLKHANEVQIMHSHWTHVESRRWRTGCVQFAYQWYANFRA